jgi:hypothetical protein
MKIIYYPNKEIVDKAIQADDPLLMLIDYGGAEVLAANIDDAFEHSILLKKYGRRETDIDAYFRVVLNRKGADWTFVSPNDYKGIPDRQKRIETFYNDGIIAISNAVKLLGYTVDINIPERYRRHFKSLK